MHLAQYKLCTRKMELALEVKFISTFTEFTRPWWWTLTNGSDVKYVFPRCRHVCEFLCGACRSVRVWRVPVSSCVARAGQFACGFKPGEHIRSLLSGSLLKALCFLFEHTMGSRIKSNIHLKKDPTDQRLLHKIDESKSINSLNSWDEVRSLNILACGTAFFVLQSTLSKRTLSKPDTSLKRPANLVPAELHLYLCNWTLAKADTSLSRTADTFLSKSLVRNLSKRTPDANTNLQQSWK